MYDGLSKDDLRIILAHQAYTSARWSMPVTQAILNADRFLSEFEALSAEPDSSQRRDDGEGEGTRA